MGLPYRVVSEAAGTTSAAVWRSSDASFVASTNAPVQIGATDFYYVDLTPTELAIEGTVVVRFLGGTESFEVVQVRPLMREFSRVVDALMNRGLGVVRRQLDTVITDVRGLLAKLIPSMSQLRRGNLP